MFEIGQQVEWTSGNILARGLVYDDSGSDTVEVRCLQIGNRKASININVVRELLIKI